MKKMLVTWVLLFAALATAEAQGLGQLYDNGQVRGIVVKLAPDGQPAVLMSIESVKESTVEDKGFSGPLPAFDRNDGRNNMLAIESYRAQYGGAFPIYDWCKSLGPGWYIPAINELYDAWVRTFGGDEKLDNYNQDLFLAVNDLVKSLGGDKMNGSMNNYPLGMLSSTLVESQSKKGTVYVAFYVEMRESAGSAVGNHFTPAFARSRKGGKISTLYMPVHMKGGIIAATHAFYRLREDAYADGIYEAPMPNRKMFGNTGREADTRLTSVGGGAAPQTVPAAQPHPEAPQAYENEPAVVGKTPAPQQNSATRNTPAAFNTPASSKTPAPRTKTVAGGKTPGATIPPQKNKGAEQSYHAPAQQQYVPQQTPAQQQYVPQQAPAQQQSQQPQQQYQAPAQPVQQPVVYANNTGWDIIIAPGQDIQCRVLRVGEKEIEYKKAGFENGPTYTISRRKAEKIIYANGQTEDVKKGMLDFIKKKN